MDEEQKAPTTDIGTGYNQGGAGPLQSARLHLLDLPTELLHEGLLDAPHSLRSTCHAFCDALDDSCRHLRLPQPAGSPRRLKDLTSLLRRLPQLRSLDNNHHDFKTLPFLAACPALQSLTLSNSTTAAHHLRALSACPQLTSLNLSDCRPLLHVNFLSSLPALRDLNLTNCESLTSLAPLEHCTHLHTLHLSRGRGGWLDLSPLSALPSLELLHVQGYDERTAPGQLDIAALASCAAALGRVNLLQHVVTTLAPLAAWRRLKSLAIGCSNAVTSLVPLAGCAPSLTQLFIRGKELASLAPLAAFTALHSLQLLYIRRVTDLSPLATCTSLVRLRLLRCDAADLSPLAALARTLSSLYLHRCRRASDLTPLAACTALTHLDLRRTPVATYLPLLACTRLVLLHCCLPPRAVPPEECAALLAACPDLAIQPL